MHKHLQLYASQHKVKTQHPSHPLHKHTTYFNTPRLNKLFSTTADTLQTSHKHSHYNIHKNKLAPYIYIIVSRHLATRGNNKYCAHLHHTSAALKRYLPYSLVVPLPNSKQTNLPSSNHTYTKSTLNHIHHHYAPSVTPTHTTHTISSTAPTYASHCHPLVCEQTPLQ